MNRALFHAFPIRWRIARWVRERQWKKSMATPHRRFDERSIARIHAAWTVVVCVVAAFFFWMGMAMMKKYDQSHMEGLYRPTPATSLRLDCGKEAAIACRAQARGERIK